MNHERNIGRDSIDESMEEEMFSTEMRLHDREKFLLGKINKQLVRLEADEIDVCEDCGEAISFRRLLARPGDHAVHRVQGAERARGAGDRAGRPGAAVSPSWARAATLEIEAAAPRSESRRRRRRRPAQAEDPAEPRL